MGSRLVGLFTAALLSTACSNSTPAPTSDGGDAGGPGSCAVAACSGSTSTCPSQSNYVCSDGCCVFICQQASDCADQPCAKTATGCVCADGTCTEKVCSADSECGSGEVCVGGSCQAPGSSAASCVLSPPVFVARAGVGVQLFVAAFDSDGGVVRNGSTAAFTVSAHGNVDSSGVFTGAGASTAPGDVTVTAIVGNAQCSAQGTVYAAATGPQAVVIDGNTGLPVTDATVLLSDLNDGTLLGAPVVGGDTLGRYSIDAQSLALGGMISVLQPNYTYLSAVAPGFSDGGTFGTTPDLIFVLAQTGPTDSATGAPYVGGFSGDFSKGPGPFSTSALAQSSGDIVLGLAGTAVPQDPAALSLAGLLGPTVSVSFPSPIGNGSLPIGTEVNFLGTPVTCEYEAVGPAGGCTLAALSDGGTFTCGSRPAWGFGGAVPFSALETLETSGQSLSLATILPAAAPSFPGFASGVGFDVAYTLAPPVLSDTVPNSCTNKAGTGSVAVPNPSALSPYNIALGTPVNLVADLTLPALPRVSGACVPDAIVLGGVLSPSVGLLPLGLSAASNSNASGQVDSTCLTYDPADPTMADGQMALHLAPAHGGLEGLPYGVLAIAGLSGGSVSGLLQTSASLPYGTTVNFGGQSFLGFPTGATYTSNARAFALGTGLSSPPTLYRLRFTVQGSNAQWTVELPPDATAVVMPQLPSNLTDRTLGAGVTVEALRLGAGATATALSDFSNGPVELNLMSQLQAFSSTDQVKLQ